MPPAGPTIAHPLLRGIMIDRTALLSDAKGLTGQGLDWLWRRDRPWASLTMLTVNSDLLSVDSDAD